MRSADRGNQRESVQPINHEEFHELSQRLDALLEEMARTAPAYSDAKAALEFSGDRRKQALADAFVAIRDLNPEEAAGSAEHRARASKGYKEAVNRLYRDEITAEISKNHFELLKVRVEVARGQLAVHRALIGMY